MQNCTLAIDTHISFGVTTQWLSFLFFAFWLGWLMFFLGGLWNERQAQKAIRKGTASLARIEHIAQGEPLVVTRVDPKVAMIGHRWSRDDEEDAA